VMQWTCVAVECDLQRWWDSDVAGDWDQDDVVVMITLMTEVTKGTAAISLKTLELYDV